MNASTQTFGICFVLRIINPANWNQAKGWPQAFRNELPLHHQVLPGYILRVPERWVWHCPQIFRPRVQGTGTRSMPKIYCFDDLSTELTLKHFGQECNVMTEIHPKHPTNENRTQNSKNMKTTLKRLKSCSASAESLRTIMERSG